MRVVIDELRLAEFHQHLRQQRGIHHAPETFHFRTQRHRRRLRHEQAHVALHLVADLDDDVSLIIVRDLRTRFFLGGFCVSSRSGIFL